MILNIPPEIVNKHRLLTKDEIGIYNLAPHIIGNEPPSGYRHPIFQMPELGFPCFIKTDGKIENAIELNKNYIFYDKSPSIRGEPHMHSLYIKHAPEDMHDGGCGGKSKKRKTNKSKKSKKNKTNKK